MRRTFQVTLAVLLCTIASATTAATEVAAAEGSYFDNFMDWQELPAKMVAPPAQYLVTRLTEIEAIKKGEFETVAENIAKKQAFLDGTLIAPSKGAIAIRINFQFANVEVLYSADEQKYTVVQKPGQPWCLEKYREPVFCNFIIADYQSKYVKDPLGRPGLYERGTAFGITTAFDSAFARRYVRFDSGVIDVIPYPIEQAREVSTKDIRIMLIGRIAHPTVNDAGARMQTPSLKTADDIYIPRKGIPFNVEGILYYVLGSPKIIAKRDFRK
ncbi:hypothetical protein GJ700_22810 [Duganella sp. FT92W]|uniref:Uncharacterized protein n=1 Tax=Pseudoduganella rivuli TaxID=2666085 RepID=A0A7X2IR93_9BURK|nr:hypothetical protein [Pseudoduganella rivuli]MRV74544.1 hypothetical protein [Pseudoduganella rivuli]